MPRKPVQSRAKHTYAAIIEAGFIVVAKDGIKGATTRNIADTAGIGVASIYEYFNNKDEIFAAMSEQLTQEIATMIKGLAPRLVRVSLADAVYEMIVELAKLLRHNDHRYLRCLQESMMLERMDKLGKVYRALTDLFTAHTFAHPEHLKVPNLPVVAYVLINSGVFTTLRYLSQPNPHFTLEEFAKGIAKMGGHYVEVELAALQPPSQRATP